MFTAIAGYLFSPVGKILMIVLAGVVIAGMGWGMLKIHDAGVKRSALLEFNNAQLEQVIKDQEKFRKAMEDLAKLQQEELERLKKERQQLEEDLEKIKEFLNSPETIEKDRPASEIIKETIRRLSRSR